MRNQSDLPNTGKYANGGGIFKRQRCGLLRSVVSYQRNTLREAAASELLGQPTQLEKSQMIVQKLLDLRCRAGSEQTLAAAAALYIAGASGVAGASTCLPSHKKLIFGYILGRLQDEVHNVLLGRLQDEAGSAWT